MARHVLVVTNSKFDSDEIERLVGVDADRPVIISVLSNVCHGITDRPVREANNYTRSELLKEIGELFKSLAAGDTFLIYFAGHGSSIGNSEFGFHCRDTDPDALSLTSLTYGGIARLMKQYGPCRGIMIFDTCHSAAAVPRGTVNRGVSSRESDVPVDIAEGTFLIWSAMAREDAFERPAGGVFTSAFLDAIGRGAGVSPEQEFVWPDQAVEYVRNRFEISGRKRQSWPGCWASGDVSALYLSANPNFVGGGTERQLHSPANDWVLAHHRALLPREKSETRLCDLACEIAARTAKSVASNVEFGGSGELFQSSDGREFMCVSAVEWIDLIACSLISPPSGPLYLFSLTFATILPYWGIRWWWIISALCLITALIMSRRRYVAVRRTHCEDRFRYFLMFTRDGLLKYSDGTLKAYLWVDFQALKESSEYFSSSVTLDFGTGNHLSVGSSALEPSLFGPIHTISQNVAWARNYYDRELDREAEAPGPGSPARTSLAVGVGSYEFLPPLRSAVADAHAFAKLFAATTNPVCVVHDLQNRDEFTKALISQMRGGSPTLLLFFSGHGVQAGTELYLAFRNTDPGRLEETGFPVSELKFFLAERRLRRLIVVLDCCYSAAGGANLGIDTPAWGESLAELTDAEQDIVVIASSGNTQESYANGKASFFSEAVVRSTFAILSAGKRASVREVFVELAAEVQKISANFGVVQNPELFARGSGLQSVLVDQSELTRGIAKQIKLFLNESAESNETALKKRSRRFASSWNLDQRAETVASEKQLCFVRHLNFADRAAPYVSKGIAILIFGSFAVSIYKMGPWDIGTLVLPLMAWFLFRFDRIIDAIPRAILVERRGIVLFNRGGSESVPFDRVDQFIRSHVKNTGSQKTGPIEYDKIELVYKSCNSVTLRLRGRNSSNRWNVEFDAMLIHLNAWLHKYNAVERERRIEFAADLLRHNPLAQSNIDFHVGSSAQTLPPASR